MNQLVLPRGLWYEKQREIVEVTQAFLLTDMRSLVVLGEAGMGKSTLLAQLADEANYAVCTARQLINREDLTALLGGATTLVVDALDEVSAGREGDAVDLVVRKLGVLHYPRFILSCRVADWRSATALQGIGNHYESPPVELHLKPLRREDAVAFLSQSTSEAKAEAAIAHLERRGLEGLWNNPQTLRLVERVVASGSLPNSKGDLFASAIPLLWSEHREEKGSTALATMTAAEVIDAAGAAFAALILTGKDAVSRKVNIAEDDLPLAEVASLSGAARLGDTLGSRLFEARGPERFTYAHRAIGEFVGAGWLARRCDTPRKERRLLALFHSHRLVPASLRGIHAWLAWHSPALAPSVIAVDPMGVVEYGDADRLDVGQAKALVDALSSLARENPHFRQWGPYRLGAWAAEVCRSSAIG